MTRTSRPWARAGLPPGTYDALTNGLPASRLWSLWLEVAEARATRRRPAELMEQWRRDRFVQPAIVDQRSVVEIDRQGVRFQIAVRSNEGLEIPLIDGGAFDWVARLISNRRAVYVASALGSQLMSLMFRRA